MPVFAIFIAKLFDPIVGLVALFGGAVARKWWQLIPTCLTAGILGELLLWMLQTSRQPDVGKMLIGAFAMAPWALIGFWAQRFFKKRD